ncbi:uncharacterized protein LOC110767474 isoform X1 [Prunus avium]|uniref:Uncharacterized protein LOC110767474 isoform X1 n=1 Tax=Prunus avium TaxID=42229 RepID=A0A6P5THK4_PRUAV|nr:uncharacterized protein LOC110767474 isoform X1 [Prunus avium]XP_021826709.1 uncharacterized protein LOC110767474 isoform X1 [Prunus avium]
MNQPLTQPNPEGSDQSQQPPPPLHTEVEDDDENVKQLKDCSVIYLSLQDCLVKTDRNWKSCQVEVQALKACNERRNNDRGK